MSEKLVMHCKGPKETTVKYNKYVVNGKLFRTFALDIGKRTKNNDMCVSTIDSETYYEKLTQLIKVEYYDRTKYVLFKCD
jgi:hypothetical protein